MQKLFSLYNLIIYSGIVTFALLGAAGVMGMMGADIEVHERAGIATFVCGSLHAGLVVYQKIKVKLARKRMQAAAKP